MDKLLEVCKELDYNENDKIWELAYKEHRLKTSEDGELIRQDYNPDSNLWEWINTGIYL